MKTPKTMTELQMLMRDEMVKSEMVYWLRNHPQAKVTFNKKKKQIEIVYPLPEDFGVNIQKIQSLINKNTQ